MRMLWDIEVEWIVERFRRLRINPSTARTWTLLLALLIDLGIIFAGVHMVLNRLVISCGMAPIVERRFNDAMPGRCILVASIGALAVVGLALGYRRWPRLDVLWLLVFGAFVAIVGLVGFWGCWSWYLDP